MQDLHGAKMEEEQQKKGGGVLLLRFTRTQTSGQRRRRRDSGHEKHIRIRLSVGPTETRRAVRNGV